MTTRTVVDGIALAALGILAVSVAAVELYISGEATGAGAERPFQMTFGTAAYVLGYLVAGVILLALGARRIYRGARAARDRIAGD